MRRTRLMAHAAAVGSRLQAYKAIALRSEFSPTWPLPLPTPLPTSSSSAPKKQVLLLDIDETLIHTFGMSHPKGGSDAVLEGVPLYECHYLARPYLHEFLKEVHELFEVIFWTSGTASYCAAIVDSFEQQILQLPLSFYHYREMAKEMKRDTKSAEASTSHANFYFLSRTQTLEAMAYMKYIPMCGRPIQSAVLIDDNVRSFPLTPRSGIKIAPFYGDDKVIQQYMFAIYKLQELKKQGKELDKELLAMLQAGSNVFSRMENDTALRDILPLLRSLANVPYGEDVRLELDHWRAPNYPRCDDFQENMNRNSVVRNELLGEVLLQRNTEPIPAFQSHIYNSTHVEGVNAELQLLRKRPLHRSKL